MISAEIHQSLRAYSCTAVRVLVPGTHRRVLYEYTVHELYIVYSYRYRTAAVHIGNPTARTSTGTTGITPVPIHCIQIPSAVQYRIHVPV